MLPVNTVNGSDKTQAWTLLDVCFGTYRAS
jgi:hypothetical protein